MTSLGLCSLLSHREITERVTLILEPRAFCSFCIQTLAQHYLHTQNITIISSALPEWLFLLMRGLCSGFSKDSSIDTFCMSACINCVILNFIVFNYFNSDLLCLVLYAHCLQCSKLKLLSSATFPLSVLLPTFFARPFEVCLF